MSRTSGDRIAAGMFAVLAAVALANLPVTIILARALSPDGYGSFQFLNRLALVVISVAQLGMPHALSWAMTQAKASTPRQREVYRLAARVSGFAGVAVAMLGIGTAVLGFSPVPAEQLILLSCLPLVNLFAAAVANAARGLLDIRAVAWIRVTQAVAWLASVGVLAVSGQLSILTALGALLGSQVLGAVAALLVIARAGALGGGPAAGTRTDEHEIWRFARRVFLGHTLRDWNVYLDQVIIGFLLPAQQLGYYALAVGVSLSIGLLSAPISATAQPLVQRAAANEHPRIIAQLLGASVVLMGTAATVLGALAWFLPVLVGEEYRPSVVLVQILCVAVTFDGINTCCHGVLLGLGAPRASSKNAALGLGVNIVCWAFLLPTIGVVGAALTSVLSYCRSFRGHVVQRCPQASGDDFSGARQTDDPLDAACSGKDSSTGRTG